MLRWTILAAACGLGFNLVFDPLFGYVYKLAIIGKPAAEVTLVWNIASTSINAVTSAVPYKAAQTPLRPALKKAGIQL